MIYCLAFLGEMFIQKQYTHGLCECSTFKSQGPVVSKAFSLNGGYGSIIIYKMNGSVFKFLLISTIQAKRLWYSQPLLIYSLLSKVTWYLLL